MVKLVVFDMDGTLLDTLGDLAQAGNYALRRMGLPVHGQEAYKLFVGSGVRNLILRMLPEEHRQDAQAVQKTGEYFGEYYGAHAQDETRPYPGMLELLRDLRDRGIKTAILSNKPDVYVQELIPQYFPGLIDVGDGQREGVPQKPDPAVVREILAHFDLGPREALYIGDSGVDMQTGKSAGLYTVGVSWGFRTKDELTGSGADVIVDKAEEILKLAVDK
jgi:phosphoglycolate phosphatase